MEKAQTAYDRATERLRGLAGQTRKNDYATAVVLHEVWSLRLYKVKYRTWKDFVSAELEMSRETANKYIRLITYGFTRDQIERIGKAKLLSIVPLQNKYPHEQTLLLKMAHEMRRDQIDRQVEEILGVTKRLRAVFEPPNPKPHQLVLVGEVAEQIELLAGTMGITPQRYIELMVISRVRSMRGKGKAA